MIRRLFSSPRGIISQARSIIPLRGLEEFKNVTGNTAVGRAWFASELRNKSFDDLHSLWYILLKEKNALATLRHAAKSRRAKMPNPERMKMVKQSMARLKTVLNEREREHKAQIEKIKEDVEKELNPDAFKTVKVKPLTQHQKNELLGEERKKMRAKRQLNQPRKGPPKILIKTFPVSREERQKNLRR